MVTKDGKRGQNELGLVLGRIEDSKRGYQAKERQSIRESSVTRVQLISSLLVGELYYRTPYNCPPFSACALPSSTGTGEQLQP